MDSWDDAPMDDAPAAVEPPAAVEAPAAVYVKPEETDPVPMLPVEAGVDVKPEADAAPVAGSEAAPECKEGYKMQRKSGYVHYCDLNRPAKKALLADDTEMNAVQKNQKIMSLLAADWRELGQEEKDRYKAEAPMHAVKIRKKKPKRKDPPAEEAAPAAAPSADGAPAPAQTLDVDGLRNLKALRDEGVLTEQEFIAKKAMMLGTHGAPAGDDDAAPVAPPPAKKPKAPKKEKKVTMELPTGSLEDFLDEPCVIEQDNPKRKETKSWASYEAYKGGATLRGMVDLGATKGMICHDYARGFVKLADPARHEALWSQRREPKKREKADPPPPGDADDGAVAADAALINMCGKYYVRRCAGARPEEGLTEGFAGPTTYDAATGAVMVTSMEGCGGICMKGIADPATGALFAPALTPKNGGKASADGTVKFKLVTTELAEGLTKASGTLSLKPLGITDALGKTILVGSYEFHAKRPGDHPPLDSTWEEKIRCFQVPDEDGSFPDMFASPGGSNFGL